jgi:hypothetical protein
MLNQSAVVVVGIDLGVVSFVEESVQGFVFAVFYVPRIAVSHCLSCIGIVFNSWLVVVFG